MSNDAKFACLKYPAEWGKPRFKLGQIVQYKGSMAFVSGINYLIPDAYLAQSEKLALGWHTEITFLTGDMAGHYESCGPDDTLIECLPNTQHPTPNFLALRYPAAWPRPLYQLGDRVWVGQSHGTIIGLTYVDPNRANDAYESEVDSGWWCEVQYPKNSLIESMGIHESAIHPVVGAVGGVTQVLGDCNTPSHPPKDRPRKLRIFLCTTKTNMGGWWFYA